MKKYYSINLITSSEALKGFGGLFTPYTRSTIRALLFQRSRDELEEMLSKIDRDKVEAFYRTGVRAKAYVDETTHRRWKTLARRYKKPAQYLITQILLRKLKEVEIW